jgi:SH3 domain protein
MANHNEAYNMQTFSKWATFFFCLLLIPSVNAETVYVTDNLNLSLRNEAGANSKVIRLLKTGTPLTVLEEKKGTGFYKVQLSDGTQGYFPIRSTMKEMPCRQQLEELNKTITGLQAENVALKDQVRAIHESITPGNTLEQSLADQKEELTRELNELKKASADVVQLKNERDELQERVVNTERDFQQIKLENQSLKDTSKQNWFLYGGFLALLGVVLGFLLPKLSWRRKSSWDTF